MKKWYVEFQENGCEYIGYLLVTAEQCKQVDARTVVADGVTIQIDEDIIEVSEAAAE